MHIRSYRCAFLMAPVILLLFICYSTVNAQNSESHKRFSIGGYVEDYSTGERLIGATIQIPEEGLMTSTNNYGFFSLSTSDTMVKIAVSFLGYEPLDTLVVSNNKESLVFKIHPGQGQLAEVVVTSSSSIPIQEQTQMSRITLSAEQIKTLPRFFGEADVLKALQLMPGVQQGSEGTAALLVRGGSPDQNLILLDGVPIYNPSHLLGIFSTFNVSTIKNVDLYKGAFPSRFGGRVSSVVDISTKDGDMKKIHGDFSVGLLASQLTVHGPIKKDKTTFLVSARRTYGDIIAKPFAKLASGNTVTPILYFYDFNAKLQHRFTDNDRIFLSLYGSKDKFGGNVKDDFGGSKTALAWANYLGSIRWNHTFSNKLFGNLTVMASDFSLDISTKYNSSLNNIKTSEHFGLKSGIRDYAAKVDFDYYPHAMHRVKAGASFTAHKFTPGSTNFTSSEDGVIRENIISKEFNTQNNELDAYIEDDWKISDKLNVNLGLHWSALTGTSKQYQQLQPRMNLRYILPGSIGLNLSYARMAQYMHLLSGNTISLPTDLWVPATDKIKPQLANQFAAGLARSILNNKMELSAELYYKQMDNVLEYKDGASYIVNSSGTSWEENVTSGKGTAYGLEVMAQKKEGRLTGWVAYTLSKTERTLPEVNFGRTFPYKYDRRHDFKTVATYRLSEGIEATGCFIFQSAMPVTLASSKYEGAEENPSGTIEDINNITSRNNLRIEPYHRLDIGVNFIKNKTNGRVRTWNVSIYNVYNRQNPFYYYQKTIGGQAALMKLSLLPVLPSISYSLKF